jgi:hypothetical protein
VTRYGLDGPGIESGGGDIFCTRRLWSFAASSRGPLPLLFTDSQLTCQNWLIDSYICRICPNFDVFITFVASVRPSVREALKEFLRPFILASSTAPYSRRVSPGEWRPG